MKKKRFEILNKVLIPVMHGCDADLPVATAKLLSPGAHTVLAGLVPIPTGESLSTGAATARSVRKLVRSVAGASHGPTRVSHQPWQELLAMVEHERPDLLVLEWPKALEILDVSLQEVMDQMPCDLAFIRGRVPRKLRRILVPLRGGPFGELALRLALTFSRATDARISSLHVRIPRHGSAVDDQATVRRDAAYRGLSRVLRNLPEIKQNEIGAANAANAIVRSAREQDLIVMGIAASGSSGFGSTARRVLDKSRCAVILVRTHDGLSQNAISKESAGQGAISVLVDKWFAENTYHADEFADLKSLLTLKSKQGLRISLAMPALNEAATVGKVIRLIKTNLMEKVPLLDEMVLIDSGSTDSTRKIAEKLGIPVHVHQELLPTQGARNGKGEALWKSLSVTRGDIVVWIDTDIVNIHPRFVSGLIGPLLVDPDLQFVKGFYRRPLRTAKTLATTGGGRVTELTARPLLNLFYPELSGVIQPLSGEYGGRRSALEQLTFYSGYGVETGLLIDIFEKYGLSAIGQVDLLERIHHNQSLEALSLMSFAIIQVVVQRLEKRLGLELLEDVNKTMKLIRHSEDRFFLDVQEINEQHRQPMATIAEYKNKRDRRRK
jgi:glucosyl-3-phosphoglycerate synthase